MNARLSLPAVASYLAKYSTKGTETSGHASARIDGGDAEGTVRFGLDGAEYEIDLSSVHNDELRKNLKTYIAHGRKVGGTARRGPRGAVRRDANAIDTTKVREWAKEQGIDRKERGRVPGKVVEEYRQAAGH